MAGGSCLWMNSLTMVVRGVVGVDGAEGDDFFVRRRGLWGEAELIVAEGKECRSVGAAWRSRRGRAEVQLSVDG